MYDKVQFQGRCQKFKMFNVGFWKHFSTNKYMNQDYKTIKVILKKQHNNKVEVVPIFISNIIEDS